MKNIIIAIIISSLLIVLALVLTSGNINRQDKSSNQDIQANNVSIKDGVQIIEIHAKGGYTPRISIAKAGIPTILRFDTNGTFDCSSSVRIPSMNIFKSLPQSGTTDIDLGSQKVITLDGTCGMGMYPFQIKFQS